QILFLLFLPLLLGAEPDHAIDWERCTVDARCFVEGKCVADNSNKGKRNYYALLAFDPTTDELVHETCGVGVQIIPLSSHKVLVYVQVVGEELATKKIGLYENDTVIVG
ncbi:hypothetical protein PFISCL1PPCAC_7865, partial [Pristionchus fissidentatus]